MLFGNYPCGCDNHDPCLIEWCKAPHCYDQGDPHYFFPNDKGNKIKYMGGEITIIGTLVRHNIKPGDIGIITNVPDSGNPYGYHHLDITFKIRPHLWAKFPNENRSLAFPFDTICKV